MAEISKDNLLRSWKEIAAYLGCDVRTCHRWEGQRGMPVHRAEGSEKKSPIFAYKDELDAWFRETFRSAKETVKGSEDVRPWLKWALAGAAVIILAGAFLREGGILARRQPADFAIEGSVLVILDKQKQELWRWDTKFEDLKDEAFYRVSFQHLNHATGNILPALIIKDIDKDGMTEVLFAPKRENDQTGEGWLYCFDRKGVERWRFPAGRELRGGGKVFSPDYRIAGFHTRDLVGDGKREIVVEAFHAPDWPCQLALLDASGKRLGEYWNAGYLRDVEYVDITGDGREELVVVGVNKEYRSGCLIVFDPRRIGGGSPQSGDFSCEGVGPGTELFYIVTLPCDVHEAMGPYTADLRQLDATGSGWIRATSASGLIFDFDFSLNPVQVTWADGFKALHKSLAEAGKVTSALGPLYERTILAGIRWWNGSEMVATPPVGTPNMPGR